MSLPGPLRWLCNLVMIILVQLLMLVQCAITYYLMRRRARRDLAPVPMQLATFSHDGQIAVVVVTYNEAANIAETLDRLASVTSTAASIAVYVIDGGSKDGTVALVESKAADPKFPLHIHTGAATGGRGPCQQKGVGGWRPRSTSAPPGTHWRSPCRCCSSLMDPAAADHGAVTHEPAME